jgi:hypothetical protein
MACESYSITYWSIGTHCGLRLINRSGRFLNFSYWPTGVNRTKASPIKAKAKHFGRVVWCTSSWSVTQMGLTLNASSDKGQRQSLFAQKPGQKKTAHVMVPLDTMHMHRGSLPQLDHVNGWVSALFARSYLSPYATAHTSKICSGRSPAREQKPISVAKFGKEAVAEHAEGQNGSHIMVRRLDSRVLRLAQALLRHAHPQLR